MITTEKQNDEWYTEEDVDSKLSWNKLEEEFVNVRLILLSWCLLKPILTGWLSRRNNRRKGTSTSRRF